ncbi:MAG: 3-deoxy-D-manno-octulosonic acid transferase [Acidobacteriota bacterium]
MWTLYRIAAWALAPLWLLVLALRQRGAWRPLQRLGFLGARSDGPIWIQAVSVGEVRIGLRLAQALASRGLPVALTTTTAAGMALARKEGPPGLDPHAFPLDLGPCMRQALRSLRPRALVLVETELWPALFREARRAGIPVLIANGRLSDRALSRTLRFKSLYARALQGVHVAAQTEEHAARFRLLGAWPERVTILGNLKYDLAPPPAFEAARQALAALLPSGPLWVAGSVREGEETAAAQAHAEVMARLPGARLVLAPRHLDRVPAALEACSRAGLRAARRSRPGPEGWDVLLLDTLGELWSAYALGAAAFVGGSLVPLGGQNVLEPAYLGRPVLFGPHTENFREDAERLVAAGGAFRVENASELAWRVTSLLQDPRLAEAAGLKAQAAVEAHRGAVDRAARWIADAIPGV